MRQRRTGIKKSFILMLFTALVLITIAGPVLALWQEILYENYERDHRLWPWNRYGHNWVLFPPPPYMPNAPHTWGVEDSSIFYNDHPEIPYYRSAWCAGLADNLMPGMHAYFGHPDGSWMRWGTFTLDEAAAGEGNFWYWADVESNALGTGDDFYVLVTDGNAASRNLDDWGILFHLGNEGTQGEWYNQDIDFSRVVDSDGDTVSYVGLDGLTIAFVFFDDGDHWDDPGFPWLPTPESGLGVFVDNISVGYDDGEYNFANPRIVLGELSQGEFYVTNDLAVGDSIGFECSFVFAGPPEEPNETEVAHRLTVYDADADTLEFTDEIRAVWANERFGESYTIMLGLPWIPTDSGNYRVCLDLDADEEMDEASEEDNSICIDQFFVNVQNDPPDITFITPDENGIFEDTVVDIEYIITNTPADETAYVSFYWDTDRGGFDGTLIHGGRDIEIEDGYLEGTLPWNISQLPDGDYYIYARMNDYYWDIQEVYAPGPVIKGELPEMSIEITPYIFDMISFYRDPVNRDAAYVFGNLDNLQIAYQEDGGIYIPPPLQTNTIGNINLARGYQIFCSGEGEIRFEGLGVDPTMDIELVGGRWNWIGYPFPESQPIRSMLSGVEDVISIVTTDDGGMWIPSLNLDIIGDMEPGQGYYVFPTEDVTFQYPVFLRSTGEQSAQVNLPVPPDAPAPTGIPYHVLVSLDKKLMAADPAVIEIYDGNTMVGKAYSSAIEQYGLVPVVCWEGVPEYNLAGFTRGHEISFRIKDSSGEQISFRTSGKIPVFGENGYAEVTLDGTAETVLPEGFVMDRAYPNPFNPSVSVPYSIPENGTVTFSIFNILGQELFSASQDVQAGTHSFLFDAGQTGDELVSGVYLLQLQYNGQTRTQKVMLLQ